MTNFLIFRCINLYFRLDYLEALFSHDFLLFCRRGCLVLLFLLFGDPKKVHISEETLGFLTRESRRHVITSERCLVKNRLIATNETPLIHAHHLLQFVHFGPTDVKDLAIIGHICVVTVVPIFTRKGFH